MSKEIELKLTLSAAAARRLAAHPLLAAQPAERRRLFNTYYDTPDFALRRRGIALRLRRRARNDWVMTVKGGDSGPGGLAQRAEWEAPTQPGVFDFSVVGDVALRDFLAALRDELRPVFSTDFSRWAWGLDYAGARIELVLDRGYVRATPPDGEERRVPLCEVELELLGTGSTDALFDLAINLAREIHLHPEIQSKAERGYALAEGCEPGVAKGLLSPLTAGMTPVEAFRAIALACLVQLQRNEAGALRGEHPEFVHQARVAIRRLRTAFKLFAPVLAPEFVAVYSPRWRELARRLGGVRDWDVFLIETLQPLEAAFPGDPDLVFLRAQAEAQQALARQRAVAALGDEEYSRLVLAFCAALLRAAPATIARAELAEKYRTLDAADFMRRRLCRQGKNIAGLVQDHEQLGLEQRHALRIAFKRLRYTLEFAAPLLPRKRYAAYLGALVALQDVLGRINDHATAARLIKSIHPHGEPQPLPRGWIAGRLPFLLAESNAELQRFLACRAPWR